MAISFCMPKETFSGEFVRTLFSVFLAFVAVGGNISGACADQSPIRVSAYWRSHSLNKYSLVMVLRNNGNVAIMLGRNALPWQDGTTGAVLTAFPKSTPSKFLEQIYYFDNSPGFVRIDPGALLEGEIDLNGRFPGLLKAIRNDDIYVSWQFTPMGWRLNKEREQEGQNRLGTSVGELEMAASVMRSGRQPDADIAEEQRGDVLLPRKRGGTVGRGQF